MVSLVAPQTISDGPGSYANDARCAWVISSTVPLTLQFSSFNLEAGYDYVNVYDGGSTHASLLRSLTGSATPTAVSSSAGQMTVEFHTDGSVTSSGFAGVVRPSASGATSAAAASPVVPSNSYVPPPPSVVVPSDAYTPPPAAYVSPPSPAAYSPQPTAPNLPPSSPAAAQCSGSVSLSSGALPQTLSDGPGPYSNGMRCVWTISAAERVTLRFESFELEANYDWLKVYDGASSFWPPAPLLRRLTGSLMPEHLVSSGNLLTLEFTTDGSVTGVGFALTAYGESAAAATPSAPPQSLAAAAARPSCSARPSSMVGDGWCDGYAPFNTAECGWDGGDCCDVSKPLFSCRDPTSPSFGADSPLGVLTDVPRNTRYSVDATRNLTPEEVATMYNNYYEFGPGGYKHVYRNILPSHQAFLAAETRAMTISGLVGRPLNLTAAQLIEGCRGIMHSAMVMLRMACRIMERDASWATEGARAAARPLGREP